MRLLEVGPAGLDHDPDRAEAVGSLSNDQNLWMVLGGVT